MSNKSIDKDAKYSEIFEEEVEDEQYMPRYVCVKREVAEEDLCESTESSCSVARTTTGNILERMITDPFCHRPPGLGKWPAYPPKSESDLQENAHQFRAAQQPTVLGQMCSLRITSEPNTFRQPAIIGTIGTASSDVNSIIELLEAGMNVARISMSHFDPCSKIEHFQNIIEANNQFKTIKDYEIPIAIMVDLKGPDIRTGKIDPICIYHSPNSSCLKVLKLCSLEVKEDLMTHPVLLLSRISFKSKDLFLKDNNFVRLTTDALFADRCTEKMIYVDYDGLIKRIKTGMTVYISEGEIKLIVDLVESTSVVCLVEKGGKLRNHQNVYIPDLPKLMSSISPFDYECLEIAVKMDVDIISVPKTRNEEVIKDVKKLLGKLNEDNNILVLATIGNYEGLENIDSILKVADGIIIQKNDLSLEIGPEKIFIAQKEIIGKCNRVGKPVLCTGQLSSVETDDNISQRIEMNDIGGGIVDGVDGIILTNETAMGDQGVKAVTRLSNIIREAEAATMQKPFYFDLVNEQVPSIEPSKAIAMAAVQIANKIQAAAILTVTTSGKTAHMLSWFRPRSPVIAISRVSKTARQLNLWRAVIPLHFNAPVHPDWFQDVEGRFKYGISYGKNLGIIHPGDLLVLVSGFRKRSGFTNSIRIVCAAIEKDGFVESMSKYFSRSNEALN